jgi:hypothetical protein
MRLAAGSLAWEYRPPARYRQNFRPISVARPMCEKMSCSAGGQAAINIATLGYIRNKKEKFFLNSVACIAHITERGQRFGSMGTMIS